MLLFLLNSFWFGIITQVQSNFFSSHSACQSVDLHFSFSVPEEINEDFYSRIPKGFSLTSFIARPILCQALYTSCFIRFL